MIEIIKQNIKNELKDRDKTIKDLCKEMNVDRLYIYRMTDEVKLSKLIDICNHIGCKIEDIVIGTN